MHEVKVVAGRSNEPAADPENTERNRLKRDRQKAAKSEEKNVAEKAKKFKQQYSSYLRLAASTYLKVPGDYYESNEGLWEPPKPREYFEPEHEYKLIKEMGQMQPTTRKMQQARIDEKSKLQATVTAEVKTSLGNLSEALTGNRTVEGEVSPTSANQNIALKWVNNDDVEDWCEKVPVEELSDWFANAKHK